MIALNTALQGIQSAETGFTSAAARIATAPANPQENLPTDIVDLMSSRNDFQANLKVVKVTDDMAKATLDLLA
jgi:hypothetical protein